EDAVRRPELGVLSAMAHGETEHGEDDCQQAAVDLAGVGADEILVFEHLEQRKEDAAGQAIEEDASHRVGSIARVGSGPTPKPHLSPFPLADRQNQERLASKLGILLQ
ncbi:MAG TPA: hypothetical protein VGG20_20565, partial [Thermoanaerobaculia bacterium]